MFGHDKFRELSSLAATAQLSADENIELRRHLVECDECREVHDDYSHLIQHKLPQADIARWRRRSVSLPPSSDVRDRFLGRARAEGLEFSPAAERPNRLSDRPKALNLRLEWWHPLIAIGATAAVVAVISVSWGVQRHTVIPVLTTQAVVRQTKPVLGDELQRLRRELEVRTAQLNAMRTEGVISKDSLRRSEAELQRAKEQLSAEIQTSSADKQMFKDTEDRADATIAILQRQNDELGQRRADDLSDLVVQKQRMRDLTDSLEQQAANLERERQLMAVTNDVRQLMGARNLHIMDVRDVNSQNGSAKAFGRVFYAEGQSLIFYAFDLPSTGASPAKYSFHAWAEKDVNSKSPRSLGTFEVDDHEQRRWVLKVNDPSMLAGVESVFVTAESLRDVKEPRGKKLLYAFIAGQPNHP